MRNRQRQYAVILGALINTPITAEQLSFLSGLKSAAVKGIIKAYREIPTGDAKTHFVFIASYTQDTLGRWVIPRYKFSEEPQEDQPRPPPIPKHIIKQRGASIFNLGERIIRERERWKDQYRKRSAESKSRDVAKQRERRQSRSAKARNLPTKVDPA